MHFNVQYYPMNESKTVFNGNRISPNWKNIKPWIINKNDDLKIIRHAKNKQFYWFDADKAKYFEFGCEIVIQCPNFYIRLSYKSF